VGARRCHPAAAVVEDLAAMSASEIEYSPRSGTVAWEKCIERATKDWITELP
jgi:hypothetical protein